MEDDIFVEIQSDGVVFIDAVYSDITDDTVLVMLTKVKHAGSIMTAANTLDIKSDLVMKMTI
jgi:molybdenum-dependent DNA-binding transcriptional regulator ModE